FSRCVIISLSPCGRSSTRAEIVILSPISTAAESNNAMLEKSEGTVKSADLYCCFEMLYFLYGSMVSTLTPNFFIVDMVASRYGFDTRFPSMFSLTPFSVLGDAIINADMNWLETVPGI